MKNPEVRKERAIDNFFQEFQFHEKERNIRAVAKGNVNSKVIVLKIFILKHVCILIRMIQQKWKKSDAEDKIQYQNLRKVDSEQDLIHKLAMGKIYPLSLCQSWTNNTLYRWRQVGVGGGRKIRLLFLFCFFILVTFSEI